MAVNDHSVQICTFHEACPGRSYQKITLEDPGTNIALPVPQWLACFHARENVNRCESRVSLNTRTGQMAAHSSVKAALEAKLKELINRASDIEDTLSVPGSNSRSSPV